MLRRLAVLTAFFMATALPVCAQSASDTYQKALRMERSDGDLNGAIKLYRQVAAGRDRSLAARALVRIGAVYERLGNRQASRAYEQVIREFADQKEAARTAEARLAALQRPASSRTGSALATRLAVSEAVDVEGEVTPDGRSLVFTDWHHGGNLAIQDIETGAARLLTHEGDDNCSYAMMSSVSRSGKLIAYFWTAPDKDCWQPQLRVINADGTGQRIIIENTDSALDYIEPEDFAPGDSTLLVEFANSGPAGGTTFSMVSLRDGSRHDITTLMGGRPRTPRLSPDGKWIAFDLVSDTVTKSRDIIVLSVDGKSKTALSYPSTDESPIWSPDGQYILFVSNRGGNVGLWAIRMREGEPQGEPILIKGDMSWAVTPLNFVGETLYYSQNAGGGNVRAVTFDPQRNVIAGSAETIVPVYLGHNMNGHWSRDGSRMVYVSRRPVVTSLRSAALVIRDAHTGEEWELGRHSYTTTTNPSISSDGRYVVAGGYPAGSTMQTLVLDALTKQIKEAWSTAADTTRPSFARFSTNGHVLWGAAMTPRRPAGKPWNLIRYDMDTGVSTVFGTAARNTELQAIAPDEKKYAYATRSSDTIAFYIVDTETGRERKAFEGYFNRIAVAGAFGFGGLTFTPDSNHLLFVKSDGTEPNYQSEVLSVDIGTGDVKPTGLRGIAIRGIGFGPGGRLTYTEGPTQKLEVWALDNWRSRLPH